MNKQTIRILEINVADLEQKVASQIKYLSVTSKYKKRFARESRALETIEERLKVEKLRLSNAECMCF